jgi:hypothetical protein
MKMTNSILLAASSVLGLAFAGSAQAAISYKYIPNQATFTVAAGSSTTVNIYLSETVTSPSTSLLGPTAENGLFGAGFKITEVSNGLASPTVIAASGVVANDDSTSQQFNGGAFNVATASATVGTLSESESFNNTAGVQLGNHPTLAGSIATPSTAVFLGTVTFIAGQTAGTTVFNLGGSGSTGTTVTFNNSDDLDTNSTSPAYTGVGATLSPISFTVVTPEPASIGLLGLASVGFLARRKRATV